MNRSIAALAALAFALLAGSAQASSHTEPLPCSYDGYPRVVCDYKMASTSSGWVEVGPSCTSPRKFEAYDRSKRVDLYADGKWVAPGKFRMRAYGSPLGPLRVMGTFRDGRVYFINRSRFPVLIDFYIDCP